ncbi:MAG: putative acid--amine ligase YgiC [Syntrophorhabdus sp. PtaU1.Bin050]|nr:MAG: putative acid--amine ligase YgiC [Syntrophorhabdus sp. PtaU1.Bin050]
MIRQSVPFIRKDWQKKVEEIGFHFYEIDGLVYWDESVYYQFSSEEVDKLEAVTETLYTMCLELVEYVIRDNLLESFAIPEQFHDYVRSSWKREEPSLYGRFDLWYDGKGEPKLLEFNADTPTALFEAGVIQYYWLQDFDASKDQFNSIHEKLLEVLQKKIYRYVNGDTFYFSSVKETLEDYTTSEYLRDVAIQGGMNTAQIFIEDIGYDHDNKRFVDFDGNQIRFLFKLYPWEYMITDEFAPNLPTTDIALFEPPWKMILSNKAILPLLWEMYPNHPNLLPSYFSAPNTLAPFVEKPFFSREGEGIFIDTRFTASKKRTIYQKYCELPSFSGNYPVIGSWIVGSQPAGMGVREDATPITNNLSRFVPHLFCD